MSIRDALRVVALENRVNELQIAIDRLTLRQDELEAAWREASRPRGAPVDRSASQPTPTNAQTNAQAADARKAQGRY